MGVAADQRALIKKLKAEGFAWERGCGRKLVVSHPEMNGQVVICTTRGVHHLPNAIAEIRRRRGDPKLFRAR